MPNITVKTYFSATGQTKLDLSASDITNEQFDKILDLVTRQNINETVQMPVISSLNQASMEIPMKHVEKPYRNQITPVVNHAPSSLNKELTDLDRMLTSIGYKNAPVAVSDEETEEDIEARKKAEELNDKAVQYATNIPPTIPVTPKKSFGVFGASKNKRKLENLQSDARGTNSIASLLGKAEEETGASNEITVACDNIAKEKEDAQPDFYHTGIKYKDDGTPRYRLAYDCPKCGASGRHYIPSHITKVSCHQCQTGLVAVPATDKGFGTDESHRDEHGNYFRATTLYISK